MPPASKQVSNSTGRTSPRTKLELDTAMIGQVRVQFASAKCLPFVPLSTHLAESARDTRRRPCPCDGGQEGGVLGATGCLLCGFPENAGPCLTTTGRTRRSLFQTAARSFPPFADEGHPAPIGRTPYCLFQVAQASLPLANQGHPWGKPLTSPQIPVITHKMRKATGRNVISLRILVYFHTQRRNCHAREASAGTFPGSASFFSRRVKIRAAFGIHN